MSAVIYLQSEILTLSSPVKSAELYSAREETTQSGRRDKTFTAASPFGMHCLLLSWVVTAVRSVVSQLKRNFKCRFQINIILNISKSKCNNAC